MNVNEQQKYRTLIHQHLATLNEEDKLGQEGQSVVILDQQAVGRLSRMDALQTQAMAMANQTRRDAKKRGLLAALQRLDDDDFGYCDGCGEEIEPKRLAFDPSLGNCITCARG